MLKSMKVKLAVCLFAMLFLIFSTGWCENIKGRLGVGYRYGFVEPDDADFKTNGNGNYLNVTYGLTENIAVECEGGVF